MQHTDLMLMLPPTTPREQVQWRTDGLSMILVELRQAGSSVRFEAIDTIVNVHPDEHVPEPLALHPHQRVGRQLKVVEEYGVRLVDERILLASESVGDAPWFMGKASAYARDGEVFGQPNVDSQGVSFPLARAYANMLAAALVRDWAAELFDTGEPAGIDPKIAKLLAWEAANAAMTTLAGYGMAVEYDVARKFREARLYLVAPCRTT